MSFRAVLSIDGEERSLLNFDYSLNQDFDSRGRPSSIAHGGVITISLESNSDTKFFEWMCNNFERKDGKITFMKRDSDAKMKELNFKEGYLIYYEENFEAFDNSPMSESFVISANSISVGEAEHINEWV